MKPQDSMQGLFLPPEIAEQAETIGVKKATMPFLPLFLLAVLAGAFIALGGNFCTIALTGGEKLPWGLSKMLGGLAFSLGLILVVIGGAELFTGNNLLVMAVASRKASLAALVRNWIIVYAGNFAGSILTALFMFWSGQYAFGAEAVGLTAVKIAEHKCSLAFIPAMFLGIYCNALVCMAVWMAWAARDVSGKVLAIVFPISAFIAGGFEHSVANMYLIPLGLFIKQWGATSEPMQQALAAAPHLDWQHFLLGNLPPVTLGNIIGGGVMVGAMYWLIYRRPLNGRQN